MQPTIYYFSILTLCLIISDIITLYTIGKKQDFTDEKRNYILTINSISLLTGVVTDGYSMYKSREILYGQLTTALPPILPLIIMSNANKLDEKERNILILTSSFRLINNITKMIIYIKLFYDMGKN
jgi:hypothetical protein